MNARAAPAVKQLVLTLSLCAVLCGSGCRGARGTNGGAAGLLTPQPAPPDTRPAGAGRHPIRVEPLHELSVVGKLGLPLGTVTDVRATVMAGRELNDKGHQSDYLLRVTHVAGRGLDEPVAMEFSTLQFVNLPLAENTFQLYEMKHGKKARGLDSTQIRKLEEGYVGKNVRLVVYETGGFSGIPAGLPPDVPSWQDRGFGFSTSLVVVAERP